MSKILGITNCRSCESSNLKKIISLGSLYLSEFTTDNKKPPLYPLSLVLCNNCLLLQLEHTTPPSLLYTDNYGYRSGINSTMRNELKEIVEKSLKKIPAKKRKYIICVDIGANDGTLLENYGKEVKKVGIEPIKKLAKECKDHADVVINDFFNFNSYKKVLGNKKATIITAISCFYDIGEPNKFLEDTVKILASDGIFVVQQNYLKSMLELGAFDNVCHEHVAYYSLHSLINLLNKHNLEVFDVELSPINGGSFRTYVAFKNSRRVSPQVEKLLNLEKKLGLDKKKIYLEFAKKIKKNKKLLKNFVLEKVKKRQKIYLYGASTRGNTLIQYFELNNKLIPFAVERNTEKWGKKIASLGIPIISEEQARKDKPDYMLVLPWFFRLEFEKREEKYLKSGGHFLFPLPKFEVV